MVEKKEASEEKVAGKCGDGGLGNIGAVAGSAVVGALALPFLLSGVALSATLVGGIVGAACGASYLAGQKE